MIRCLLCVLLAAGVVTTATATQPAQKKKVEISNKWSGSVEDEKATRPEVITTPKGLEGVWKAWKIAGDVPRVDFDKNVVVAVYSSGSKLNMAGATLDDKGDLQVLGFGTRDLRPGFRYVLGVVSKEGVKTVNKKKLPKE